MGRLAMGLESGKSLGETESSGFWRWWHSMGEDFSPAFQLLVTAGFLPFKYSKQVIQSKRSSQKSPKKCKNQHNFLITYTLISSIISKM